MKKQETDYKQVLIAVGLMLLLVVVSFSAGLLASKYLPIFSSTNDFPILEKSLNLVNGHFFGSLPETRDMEYGMIKGMLVEIGDPYTVLVEPVQNELQTDQLTGSFGGIGARLEWDSEGHLLLYPFPESSAQKAGVQDGDRLLNVDDTQINEKIPVEEILAAIRGKVGTVVELTLARLPDYSKIIIKVTREEIGIPSVTWNLTAQDRKVGIVQINVISATTPDEVKKAILDLQNQQAEYFILDLRNNSGGLVNEGIQTAELFLRKGNIFNQQYKDQPVDEIANKEDGLFIDLPIAVLINHNSASAAEIIAGAMQGQQRAALVGSQSFGKDSIQLVFELGDGSSLHVTTAHWWIPGLTYTIHEQGLIPDVILSEDDANSQAAIEAAISVLRNP